MKPYLHTIGDFLAAVLLLVLGSVGFHYDDQRYLGKGMWRHYDMPNWLSTEIAAGIFMIIVL